MWRLRGQCVLLGSMSEGSLEGWSQKNLPGEIAGQRPPDYDVVINDDIVVSRERFSDTGSRSTAADLNSEGRISI